MQHQYIQNLQKANLFLKAKVKELQKPDDESNKENKQANIVDTNVDVKTKKIESDDEFRVIPIGKIEQVNKFGP